jgi:hypothetical protein
MSYEAASTPSMEYLLSQITEDQLRNWRTIAELKGAVNPFVIDTSYVRNGLKYQLTNNRVPASIADAQSGHIRLFMDVETLAETWLRLDRFATQFEVPVETLQSMFEDWRPAVSVVRVPDALRSLDPRAVAVRDLDPDDYPAAALAALLSPCVLLTTNTRHFAPLGVRERSQGADAIVAAFNLRVGETQLQAVTMVPAAPVYAVGAATKWAYEKIGPAAWVALALVAAGGVMLYRKQTPERQEAIRRVVFDVAKVLADEYARASQVVVQSQETLGELAVPGPSVRSPESAVLRHLARSPVSMSAQQLSDVLRDGTVIPVESLRHFLHAHAATMFDEVRRGGFVLGRPSIALAA